MNVQAFGSLVVCGAHRQRDIPRTKRADERIAVMEEIPLDEATTDCRSSSFRRSVSSSRLPSIFQSFDPMLLTIHSPLDANDDGVNIAY